MTVGADGSLPIVTLHRLSNGLAHWSFASSADNPEHDHELAVRESISPSADLVAVLPDMLGVLYDSLEMELTCPYSLSVRDSLELDLDREELGLTYGEITPGAMVEALLAANATASDVLLDLGSGSGRAALAGASAGVGHVFGIELLPSLVALACAAVAKAAEAPDQWPVAVRRATFLQADFLQTRWWEGLSAPSCPAAVFLPSIVYIAATKWQDVLPQLTCCVLRLPIGTRVLVTSLPLVEQSDERDVSEANVMVMAKAVEIWCRTVQYLHGPELMRMYEIRAAVL